MFENSPVFFSNELKTACAAALKAGQKVMEIYKSDFTVSSKEEKEPFTEADTESEKIIIAEISRFGHPILSEESKDDPKRLGAGKAWIVDPLDGTTDFINRTGEFSVMIAMLENQACVIGVIYQPTAGILYIAERGRGSYKYENGAWQRLEVSREVELGKSRAVMSRSHLAAGERQFLEALGVKRILQSGSAGLKAGLIASGQAELYFTFTDRIKQWDTAAAFMLISEAGGRTTDMRGRELVYNTPEVRHLNGILITNGRIHEAVTNRLIAGSGTVIWFTGLSGSGKTTIANELAGRLESQGKRVKTLDGDAIRSKNHRHLGFFREDIRENNLRIAELAEKEAATHDFVLVTVIAPYSADRALARSIIGDKFVELYANAPIEVCISRDVKGLYSKAKRGELTNLIGFHAESPYETPVRPEIEVRTADLSIGETVDYIIKVLDGRSTVR